MQDLNLLFLELGHLVNSQADEVATVTTLANETADDVARARAELERTEEQQNGCALQ